MKKEELKYDLDELDKQGQAYMDTFKKKMKAICEEILGNMYVDLMPHIESDTWTNYRNVLRNEYENDLKTSYFKSEYGVRFRRLIFQENKKEMVDLINKDLLKENKKLTDILNRQRDMY